MMAWVDDCDRESWVNHIGCTPEIDNIACYDSFEDGLLRQRA